ncbi:antitoxin VapB family protein [Candidatus Woesearchaeota archaeon]|nr:antitoxin VapB family protein [Candidatus Woesearchaeota archaeon]
MAKTIMIANNVYEELKEAKKDRSFSETIKELIEKSRPKTGAGLKDCIGLLPKEDKEYEEIMRELKPLYKKWTQRYA